MLKTSSVILVAIFSLSVSSYSAAETQKPVQKEKDHGIRISLGMAPGINELISDSSDFTLDDDSGLAFEILYQRRHWSDVEDSFCWTWGAGFLYADHPGSSGVIDFDLTGYGALVQGGIAIKAGKIIVFEFQPYGAIGAANLESSASSGKRDESGLYYMVGLKAGGFIQVTERIELGVEVGYQTQAGDAEIDGVDGSLVGEGPRVNGVVAIKF